jgi:hypothetical protein
LLSLTEDTLGFAPASAVRGKSPAAAAAAKYCMKSSIGKDSLLTRLAEKSTKNQKVQDDLDRMFRQLSEGNLNPGRYTKSLTGTGLLYARADNGGRLFFRVSGDTIEIVGKSDKHYEDAVIGRLKKLYGR